MSGSVALECFEKPMEAVQRVIIINAGAAESNSRATLFNGDHEPSIRRGSWFFWLWAGGAF